MIPKTLTITDEHVKLLRRMCVGHDSGVEYGAPTIDPKRPYGDSDVPVSIYKALGWEMDTCPNCGPLVAWDDDRAEAIHRQMTDVLQIALRHYPEDVRGEWVGDGYAWSRASVETDR